MNDFDPTSVVWHCEKCGTELAWNEFVAVGPSTPAAHELGLFDPKGGRDYHVTCDPCFTEASEQIAEGGGNSA